MTKAIDKLIAQTVIDNKDINYDDYNWYVSDDVSHIMVADVTSIHKNYVILGYSKKTHQELENEFR